MPVRSDSDDSDHTQARLPVKAQLPNAARGPWIPGMMAPSGIQCHTCAQSLPGPASWPLLDGPGRCRVVLFPVTQLEHCNSGAPSHKGASRRTLARERAQYERQRHSHANLKHNLNLKSACAEGASGLNPITEPCRHSSAGQHWRSIYYLNPIDPGRALQRGRRSRVESSSRAISNLCCLFRLECILSASSGLCPIWRLSPLAEVSPGACGLAAHTATSACWHPTSCGVCPPSATAVTTRPAC